MSKKATYRFSDEHDKWLEEQAQSKGMSKNDILRQLISEKLEEKGAGNNK